MAEDFADRHVARWRDHWIEIPFDDEVEAATVRFARIERWFREAKQRAALEVGLQDFEYDTLHMLMIRDTPGRATPRDLARDLGVSPAGMTGRLDGLEKAGWIQRTTSTADRRRVDVEATGAGVAVWRRAMALRGQAEEQLLGELTPTELRTLNRLLKKLTTAAERPPRDSSAADPAGPPDADG
jgi:DNA-binding MarR family transcriptional regulator